MDCKSVGERIKARKHELDITANDLCEKSGVPLDTINNIVYGRITNPSIESLSKIAIALDTSLDHLVLGKPLETAAKIELPKEIEHKCKFDIERYIQVLNEVHQRELDAQAKAKDELIVELRSSLKFWRTLSCILVGFLAAILLWFTWDILHPDQGLIKQLQSMGLIGRNLG